MRLKTPVASWLFVSMILLLIINLPTVTSAAQPSNGVAQPFYLSSANYPAAVNYNGRTYVVWNGEVSSPITPDPYITYYNPITGVWATSVKIADGPLIDDYHGAPIIIIDDNDYIHIFYGGHGTDLKHSKSVNPEDISSWTAQSVPATNVTYPSALKHPNGDIYIFYRRGEAGLPKKAYSYVKSTDNGTTWDAFVDVVDFFAEGFAIYPFNTELYGNDEIHIGWRELNESTGARTTIYHAFLNISDNNMYAIDGTNLGSLVDKTEADANLIVDVKEEVLRGTLHLDDSGTLYMLYGSQSIPGGDYNTTFARWKGGAWVNETVVTSGDGGAPYNYHDFIVHALEQDPFEGISEELPTGGEYISATGLLLSYDMETLSSGLMRDFSGNDNNGTITGANSVTGLFGQARNFEADDEEYITVPEDDSLDGKRTIALWFKPEGGWSSAESLSQQLVNHRSDIAEWNGIYLFLSATDGSFYVAVDSGAPAIATAVSTTTSWSEVWYHVVAVADGSNILLYINGMLEDTGDALSTAFPDVIDSNPLRIGTKRTADDAFYDGLIDEMLIFNRILNASEISYLAGSPPANIEAYITTAGASGFGGDMERWSWDGITWSQEEIILTESEAGVALNNPKVPLNYSLGAKMFFSEVDRTDFSNADLKIYVYPAVPPPFYPPVADIPFTQYFIVLGFLAILILTLVGAWRLKEMRL